MDVTGLDCLGISARCVGPARLARKFVRLRACDWKEVFDLIAADCIPGGSRDNLAYANEFTEWEG